MKRFIAVLFILAVSLLAFSQNWNGGFRGGLRGAGGFRGGFNQNVGNEWLYKMQVIVTTDTGRTNYPVKIPLNSGNFDFTHAKTNGEDLRFFNTASTVVCYHWIESWDNIAQTAVVWVRFPTVTAGANKDTVNMFYGCVSASSSELGDSVFYFYNEFNTDASTHPIANIDTFYGVKADSFVSDTSVTDANNAKTVAFNFVVPGAITAWDSSLDGGSLGEHGNILYTPTDATWPYKYFYCGEKLPNANGTTSAIGMARATSPTGPFTKWSTADDGYVIYGAEDPSAVYADWLGDSVFVYYELHASASNANYIAVRASPANNCTTATTAWTDTQRVGVTSLTGWYANFFASPLAFTKGDTIFMMVEGRDAGGKSSTGMLWATNGRTFTWRDSSGGTTSTDPLMSYTSVANQLDQNYWYPNAIGVVNGVYYFIAGTNLTGATSGAAGLASTSNSNLIGWARQTLPKFGHFEWNTFRSPVEGRYIVTYKDDGTTYMQHLGAPIIGHFRGFDTASFRATYPNLRAFVRGWRDRVPGVAIVGDTANAICEATIKDGILKLSPDFSNRATGTSIGVELLTSVSFANNFAIRARIKHTSYNTLGELGTRFCWGRRDEVQCRTGTDLITNDYRHMLLDSGYAVFFVLDNAKPQYTTVPVTGTMNPAFGADMTGSTLNRTAVQNWNVVEVSQDIAGGIRVLYADTALTTRTETNKLGGDKAIMISQGSKNGNVFSNSWWDWLIVRPYFRGDSNMVTLSSEVEL